MSSRVLLVSRTFLPEVNAAAFRLGALARALVRRGAEVDVITSVPPPGLVDPPFAGMHVRRMPVLRDRGGNVRGYLQYMSFDVPLAFRIVFRRFDVVISEAPPTTGLVVAVVAGLRRRPFVYYAADVWTDGVTAVGAPRAVVGFMSLIEKFVLSRASAILSVSEGVTDRLVALGAAPERITMVGHGIDTDVFSPAVEAMPTDAPYFVYTGTMSEVHSPQVFIHGFAEIADREPEVRLRFFGQGVFEDELRRLAERIVPGRVDFGGVVPPERVAQWIRGAAGALVSLAPGVGYDYAHPTKAYAAAACGTPILFAGVREFGEIVIDAGLGESVDFTPEAVAAGMRRMLESWRTGLTEQQRAPRAEWAEENASLAVVGEKGAEAALTARRSGVTRSTSSRSSPDR